MAGLKQIMEIFMTINQPLSSEQRVRWYIQRIPLLRIMLLQLKSLAEPLDHVHPLPYFSRKLWCPF